ncbi:hypothetical protein [Streptomyces tauricus]
MTTEEFVMLFGSSGHVRASLDWSRVTELRLRVQQSFHTSADRLGRMTTLWYTGPDGTLAEYTHPQAAPLTTRQAAATDMRTLPQRQSTLNTLTHRPRDAGNPSNSFSPPTGCPTAQT